MIVTLLLLLQEAPVRVGTLEFTPPSGWKLDARTELYAPMGNSAAGLVFSLAGPVPTGDRRAEDVADLIFKQIEGRFTVDKAGTRDSATFPSGLQGWSMKRTLRKGRTTYYTHEAVLEAKDGLYYFFFASEKEEGRSGAELKAILESVRTSATIAPEPFAGKTARLEALPYRLEIPADWEEFRERENTAYRFARVAPRKIGNYRVLVEATLGKPRDPKQALLASLEGGYDAFFGREKRSAAAEILEFDTWRMAGGGQIAGITIQVREKYGPCARRGFLLWKGELALFLGSEWGWYHADDGKEETLAEFQTVVADMIRVVTNAKLELPPAREEWSRWLAKKGMFRANTSGSGGTLYQEGANTLFYTSSVKKFWTFHGDQSFDLELKSEFNVTMNLYFESGWPGYRHYDPLYSPVATKERSAQGKSGGIEVRGRGDDDLWIVAYHKDGPATFHRFEPYGSRRYFDIAYQVMMVDGQGEGTHEYGQGYSLYYPPPGALVWAIPGKGNWVKSGAIWVPRGQDGSRAYFRWRGLLPGAKFSDFHAREDFEVVDAGTEKDRTLERTVKDRGGRTWRTYERLLETGKATHLFQLFAAEEFEARRAEAAKLCDGVRVEEGKEEAFALDFKVPDGWKKTDDRQWMLHEGKDPVALFSWAGPVKSNGGPLEKQFETFHRTMQDQWEVVEASETQELEIPSGLKAFGMARAVRMKSDAKVALATFEAVFQSGEQIYYFLFATGSAEKYKEILARDIAPLMQSVKRR